MKNGTILLWDKRKTNKGFRLFISKMITYVTKSEVTHSGIYLNGMLLEQDRLPNGKEGLLISFDIRKADWYLEPEEPLTEAQAQNMFRYIVETYNGYGYNLLKLVFMAILSIFKPFFRLIRWMPFDKPWYGEVCSVMPDEAYQSIGVDLFPDEFEGYTVPGDYLKCNKLIEVTND